MRNIVKKKKNNINIHGEELLYEICLFICKIYIFTNEYIYIYMYSFVKSIVYVFRDLYYVSIIIIIFTFIFDFGFFFFPFLCHSTLFRCHRAPYLSATGYIYTYFFLITTYCDARSLQNDHCGAAAAAVKSRHAGRAGPSEFSCVRFTCCRPSPDKRLSSPSPIIRRNITGCVCVCACCRVEYCARDDWTDESERADNNRGRVVCGLVRSVVKTYGPSAFRSYICGESREPVRSGRL